MYTAYYDTTLYIIIQTVLYVKAAGGTQNVTHFLGHQTADDEELSSDRAVTTLAELDSAIKIMEISEPYIPKYRIIFYGTAITFAAFYS